MIDNYLERRALPWTEIPTALLRAELERRQDESTKPACGSDQRGVYNTSAHVFALILIFALSTVCCGFPLVSRRTSKHTGPNKFVFFSQYFGTGVLIATAFVHLLPTAFVSLTNPCLPWIWNQGYKPMAGVIAMTSALIVVGIEMFLRTRGAGHSHSYGQPWERLSVEDEHDHGMSQTNGATKPIRLDMNPYGHRKLENNHRPIDLTLGVMGSSESLIGGASPLAGSSPQLNGNVKSRYEDGDIDSTLDLEEQDPATELRGDVENQANQMPSVLHEDNRKRLMIQCMLLEAGILFHSVFIGMAVSVATGTPFVVFLIAISFHQSFEGLALGSRIAAINFSKSSPKPWLMVLAYGTTTPIGQAIGLLVQRSYDPYSEAGLLMVGIMNAVSSGLLLFAGLVQLLAEDFLSDKSYETLKGRRRWHAYIAVIGGATLMALVGAWA